MYNQLLSTIIHETFTSPSMQNYLCENIESLNKSSIVDIVRKSFIPLCRKQELFEVLCEYESKEELEREIALAQMEKNTFREEFIKEYSFYYQLQSMQRAFAGLTEMKKGKGLLLLQKLESGKGQEEIVDDNPFFTYDKCRSYIENYFKEYPNYEDEGYYVWHIIKKYDEDMNGDLQLSYTYYLFEGEIIYYDDEDSKYGSDVFGGDLNLPAPFKTGDIITCDGGPTGQETRAVIVGVGDNRDCCSLIGLCKREDGTLGYGVVKHSIMYYAFHSCVYVPPLFSAKILSDEQVDNEVELKKISDFVCGDDDRGHILLQNARDMSLEEVTDEWIQEQEVAYQAWKQKNQR